MFGNTCRSTKFLIIRCMIRAIVPLDVFPALGGFQKARMNEQGAGRASAKWSAGSTRFYQRRWISRFEPGADATIDWRWLSPDPVKSEYYKANGLSLETRKSEYLYSPRGVQ